MQGTFGKCRTFGVELKGGQGRDVVASYRAMLRYPIAAILHIPCHFLTKVCNSPELCDTSPWYLFSHRHICAITHFATHRAIIVRYPPPSIQKQVPNYSAILSLQILRPVLGRADFSRIFIFEPPDFFRGLCRPMFSSFLWEKLPRKSRQNPPNFINRYS